MTEIIPDETTMFIRLSEAENKIVELSTELDYLRGLVRASGDDRIEAFLTEVHFIAVATAQQVAPTIQAQADSEACPHRQEDLVEFAVVGLVQCRACGSNLPRDFLKKNEQEMLEIAQIVGVSVPEEPLPLIPGLQPPKHHFRNDGC